MSTLAISSRRSFLGAAATVVAIALTSPALSQGSSAKAQEIANHFSSIRTMTGEFVQFGPRGEQTGGKFFLERPGKIRFNYDAPSNFKVTADGKSVIIENVKLKTSDLYPLSKTPLSLLLGDKIDLRGGRVTNVKEEADITTIKMADKSVFGNSTITMMFDTKSNELRQWTITDAKGKDTTVMISSVRTGVRIDPAFFRINYQRNREMNQGRRGGGG